MLGAAQWIMWSNECHYVYQQCKKVESMSGLRQMWSMERWREWKRQFAFVAGDERFAQIYREVVLQTPTYQSHVVMRGVKTGSLDNRLR